MDTKKNLETIVTTNLAFVGASKENTEYMMVENRKVEKDLEATRQHIEKIQAETQRLPCAHMYLKELQASRFGEVRALGSTMTNLYEELVTMHKPIVPLHDMQNKSWENTKSLKVIHATITIVHEWRMKYRGAPSDLVKKTRK